MIRNLAYHVFPVKGNGVWQWNLDQLRRRLRLFNGKRVVAVAVDETTDTLQTVQEHLDSPDIEWLSQPNDRQWSEGATWVPIWKRLRGSPGVTFRAHAKGVTSRDKIQTVKCKQFCSVRNGVFQEAQTVLTVGNTDAPASPTRPKAMRLWADAMYRVCLDDLAAVDRCLASHPIAGPFKQVTPVMKGPMEGLIAPWQFMGSFYWVRNADFFQRDWRRVIPSYYAPEVWPGFNFTSAEATCLFCEVASGQWLSDLGFLETKVEPALQAWEEERCTWPPAASSRP